MKIHKRIPALKKHLETLHHQNKTIGFIPTMGALHEGHLSLIRKARKENDIVVVSIFVNPTQFAPNEDLAKYPRPLIIDKKLVSTAGADLLFLPTNTTMYPEGPLTEVNVNELTQKLCGKIRPTHFQGVTTIVTKLINIIKPTKMYLGQKDAQQALVIKKMINDLNLDVKLRVCPIIREKDGLALSSRNKHLSVDQRRESIILYKSLKRARQRIKDGEKKTKIIIDLIAQNISNHSQGIVEYIVCVDEKNLEDVKNIEKKVLIALAIKFGSTRLIDNIIIKS